MNPNDPEKRAKISTETPPDDTAEVKPGAGDKAPREIGGPEGPEPTRYGDWEKNGRCFDF